jgi:hypothetical protein
MARRVVFDHRGGRGATKALLRGGGVPLKSWLEEPVGAAAASPLAVRVDAAVAAAEAVDVAERGDADGDADMLPWASPPRPRRRDRASDADSVHFDGNRAGESAEEGVAGVGMTTADSGPGAMAGAGGRHPRKLSCEASFASDSHMVDGATSVDAEGATSPCVRELTSLAMPPCRACGKHRRGFWCPACERYACSMCVRQCESCEIVFCNFCSTVR